MLYYAFKQDVTLMLEALFEAVDTKIMSRIQTQRLQDHELVPKEVKLLVRSMWKKRRLAQKMYESLRTPMIVTPRDVFRELMRRRQKRAVYHNDAIKEDKEMTVKKILNSDSWQQVATARERRAARHQSRDTRPERHQSRETPEQRHQTRETPEQKRHQSSKTERHQRHQRETPDQRDTRPETPEERHTRAERHQTRERHPEQRDRHQRERQRDRHQRHQRDTRERDTRAAVNDEYDNGIEDDDED
ncbi:trichohyalin-like [Homarus americanus]|uniref:trichohyalin-like n=1 Tax=Homarus americanus TaxID=6706 RepID=UPI001C43CE2F|nr:trichohyalin-like [Homarus americanus]